MYTIDDLKTLSEDMQILVCFIAYRGDCYYRLSDLGNTMAWDYDYISRMKNVLCEKGFIKEQEDQWGFHKNLLPTFSTSVAAFKLLAENMSWKKMFYRFCRQRTELSSTINALTTCCITRKPKGISVLDFPESLLNQMWIEGFFDTPDGAFTFNALSDDARNDLIDLLLRYDALYCADKGFRTLKKLSAGFDKPEFREMIRLYDYVYDGVYNADPFKPTGFYSKTLVALHEANSGRFRQALEMFIHATLVCKPMYHYQYLLFEYYFVMTAYCAGEFGRNWIEKNYLSILKRYKYGDNDYLTNVIVKSFEANTPSSSDFDVSTNSQMMRLLIDEVAKGLGLNVSESKPAAMPAQKLLLHQVRDLFDLTPAQRAELDKLYGSKTLMQTVPRMKPWEKALYSLEKIIDRLGVDTEPERRLVYVIGADGMVRIMRQRRLKNGQWSKPSFPTTHEFAAGESYFDTTDHLIKSLFKTHNIRHGVKMASILPNLVGCKRVLRELRGRFEPVTVAIEPPMISLIPTENAISISSNVPQQLLDYPYKPVVIAQRTPTHYVVFNLTSTQATILSSLENIDSIPIEAIDRLKPIIEHLSRHIQVSTDLIESNSSVESVQGDSRIMLRITPEGLLYDLEIGVRPMADSDVYFSPGQGEPTTFVYNTEGVCLEVCRDLEAESAHFDLFKHAIPAIPIKSRTEGLRHYSIEPELLLDILDFAATHPEDVYVEWPEGKHITVDNSSAARWDVSVHRGAMGWFDIEGSVRLSDGFEVSMARILAIIQAEGSKKYIRLEGDRFLSLSDKLRKRIDELASFAQSKGDSAMVISDMRAALINDTDSELPIAIDDSLQQLRQRIKEAEHFTPAIPDTLHATLRPYQIEGFRWMARLGKWGAGACLADDMGLGKTVQTIAYMLSLQADEPILVVAPASVVPNWVQELKRFAPSLRPVVLNTADDRSSTIAQASRGDVVVCTYAMLHIQEEAVTSKQWALAVLDEAHTIKNRSTKMSAAAMNVNAHHRIILTGTPLQNNLSELWNLFRFINPGLLGSYEMFNKRFVQPIQEHNSESASAALQRLISPFMLRRTKTEVAADLPEKLEITLPVQLSESEIDFYEALRRNAVDQLKDINQVDVNALAELTRLRRAACTPRLIDPHWQGEQSKTQALIDLIDRVRNNGGRALVFSQFTSYLKLIRAALKEAEVPYLYLDGSTTMAVRLRLVAEFAKGETPVFLISLKAGGLGLNLTAANYVIHADPWWNPAIEDQASDRAYRIGQKQDVTVYRLIAQNTIEEKMLRLHQSKRNLADSMLASASVASSLTAEDILDLIQP